MLFMRFNESYFYLSHQPSILSLLLLHTEPLKLIFECSFSLVWSFLVELILTTLHVSRCPKLRLIFYTMFLSILTFLLCISF